jgi:hypothetical protein
VPSFEYSRIHGVSNLSAFSDGLRVLRTILRECPPAHRVALSSAAQAWAGRPRPGIRASAINGHERLPQLGQRKPYLMPDKTRP